MIIQLEYGTHKHKPVYMYYKVILIEYIHYRYVPVCVYMSMYLLSWCVHMPLGVFV